MPYESTCNLWTAICKKHNITGLLTSQMKFLKLEIIHIMYTCLSMPVNHRT